MEIEHLAAVIRPRTPWEAIDLGVALGRRWFPTLLGLWWLTALPVALIGMAWLWDSPGLWLILVWWFKPLYEAPLLYWLGRRLFGESPGLRELWTARRQILPMRLSHHLLWRRLSPSRSFQMPLTLLEGLGGRDRRLRQKTLQLPGGIPGWLTVIGVHFESILWVSAVLLLAIMIPNELPGLDLSAAFLAEGSPPYWISTLLCLVAMSVMAPFYVAAGFSLYLARRTELEAWDLSLQFRRFSQLRQQQRRRPASAVAMVTLALTAGFSSLSPSPAPAVSLTPAEAQREIEAVLAADDFGRAREIQTWVYVGGEEAPGQADDLPAWLVDLLQGLGRGAELGATMLKWLLYLAGAVLILVLLQRILGQRARRRRRSSASDGDNTPTPRPRLREGAAQLPADIPAAVGARLAAGDARGGLALLYTASIALLSERQGLEIPESATEAECLATVLARRPPEETGLMRRVVGLWQRLAYAHLEPQPAELEVLLSDWRNWQAETGGR